MNLILFDDIKESLFPFTYTRPVAEIRVGILTIAEKWRKRLDCEVSYLADSYLSTKFPLKVLSDNIIIAGSLLPDSILVEAITKLKEGQILLSDDLFIAAHVKEEDISSFSVDEIAHYNIISFTEEVRRIKRVYDIFRLNGDEIKKDFNLLTVGRISQPLSESNKVVGIQKNPKLIDQIFIEEGAFVECAYLNPSEGPIYVAKDAVVQEGSMVRGPFALCEGSQVKMGAKIYGATTVGPHSKVGGEVSNSVIFGYSNKGHDGYLGDSVIGEWCNLGADTNNSNLKNDYDKVRVWDYSTETFEKSDLQFCGLILGDYSKSAINTMFNTATVVGVASNIFGSGFPRTFIPSFSFGGAQKTKLNPLKSVFKTASVVMQRRHISFTKGDEEILTWVFNRSQCYRNF